MSWKGVITTAGAALMAQWTADPNLKIQAAYGGTGTVDEVGLAAQTELFCRMQNASLISGAKTEKGAKIKVQLTSNSDGYTLNQIGLFAATNDSEMILFALFQNAEGVKIPSSAEAPDFVYTFFGTLAVSNDVTLELTIDTSAVVTIDTLNEAIAALTAEDLNAYEKEEVLSPETKEQLGFSDDALPDEVLALLGARSFCNLERFRSCVFTTSTTWTAPDNIADNKVNVIVVGGGGGGGCASGYSDADDGHGGGGGGAGGLVITTLDIIPGMAYDVVIGAGGAGASDPDVDGNDGGQSSFGDTIALGGKCGKSYNNGAHGGDSPGMGGGGGGGTIGNGGNGGVFGGGGGAYGGSGGNGGTYGGGGASLNGTSGNGGKYGGNAGENGTEFKEEIFFNFEYFSASNHPSSGAASGGGGGYGGTGGEGSHGGGGGFRSSGGKGYLSYVGGGGGGGFFGAGRDGNHGRTQNTNGKGGGGGGGFFDSNFGAGGNGGLGGYTADVKNGSSGIKGVVIITYYQKEAYSYGV